MKGRKIFEEPRGNAARGQAPHQALRGSRWRKIRGHVRRPAARVPRRRRRQLRRARAGSAWGWSANRAAARPPPRSMILRSVAPDAGSVVFRRGRRCSRLERARSIRLPAQGPVRVPGPVQLAQSAHDRVRHRQRAARHPQDRRRGRALRAGQGADGPGRPRRALPAPLPAQLLRRPAPADRHRARPRARPGAADLRRAGVGARRLGAGAGAQSARGPAAPRSG